MAWRSGPPERRPGMARESVILTAARLDRVKRMVVARRARVALFIGPTANASGENEKPETFGRSVWNLADAELVIAPTRSSATSTRGVPRRIRL